MENRIVHEEDAIAWFQKQESFAGCSFVVSLPDFSEFPKLTVDEWKKWFTNTAALVLSKCPADGLVFFYQRDKKLEGEWINKGYLIQKAAEQVGVKLLWQKIVCRIGPGKVSFGKPAYSQLLCFSPLLKDQVSLSTADVIVEAGQVTWARGMGRNVCEIICREVKKNSPSQTLVVPFCGEGLFLAVANCHGFKAIGIERSKKRAEKARLQTLDVAAPSLKD